MLGIRKLIIKSTSLDKLGFLCPTEYQDSGSGMRKIKLRIVGYRANIEDFFSSLVWAMVPESCA